MTLRAVHQTPAKSNRQGHVGGVRDQPEAIVAFLGPLSKGYYTFKSRTSAGDIAGTRRGEQRGGAPDFLEHRVLVHGRSVQGHAAAWWNAPEPGAPTFQVSPQRWQGLDQRCHLRQDIVLIRARTEHIEDILELADGFLEEIGRSVGRPAAGIARDAREQLLAYHWPGNVRELRNAIERAVILADGGEIHGGHLPVTAARASAEVPGTAAFPPGGVNLEAIERALVVQALAQARHNKTRAARLLGLTRAQLYTRIEKYGLAETGT